MGKKFSRMKTNDIRVIKLMKEGFSFETLRNLNDSQINVLYKRIVKEQETGTVTTKDPNKAKELAKDGVNVRLEKEIGEDMSPLEKDAEQDYTGQEGPHDEKDMAPDGMDDDSDNNRQMMGEKEIKEKAVSKKQQKFMGLVKSYKEGDVKPSDVSKSVKDAAKSMTKKEVDDFASTKHEGLPTKVENTKKESYLRNVKMIEESLIKLVQKHITPTMTKKDLMNLVEQGPGTKEAPTIAPTKTPSKPERKNPYKPKHKPAPKAKKDDETFAMQLPSFLKFDNLNIQFSDEKES